MLAQQEESLLEATKSLKKMLEEIRDGIKSANEALQVKVDQNITDIDDQIKTLSEIERRLKTNMH